jgi:hypothetical protein
VEKPHWDDDIDSDEILPTTEPKSQKKKKKKRKADEIDLDGVDVDAMDAEVPKKLEEEEWDGTEEMRKRKVQEYMDEVYGMDFNDMVPFAVTSSSRLLPVLTEAPLGWRSAYALQLHLCHASIICLDTCGDSPGYRH